MKPGSFPRATHAGAIAGQNVPTLEVFRVAVDPDAFYGEREFVVLYVGTYPPAALPALDRQVARSLPPSDWLRPWLRGWTESEAMMLADNFKKAMSFGAYVMQSLRSKMGDVHGTRPVLLPLAFDTLKWPEIMVRTLATREIQR